MKTPLLGLGLVGAAARRLFFSMLAGALLGPVALLAQSTDAAPKPTTPDDDMVKLPTFSVTTVQDKGYLAGNSVSGTRIDTPIKDLPFAVNAFTQQFITDIGARSLGDVVQYAPGVTAGAKQIVQADGSYMIRGFQQSPQTNGFATPSASATAGPFVDTVAIERVEVVKGPASLLYGNVAPGGTVNYITKRPEKKAFVAVSGRIGSLGDWRTTVDINQPLIGDTLLLRFNGAYERGPQYVKPTNHSHTWVAAPTVTWNIVKRVTLKVDYHELRRVEDPPAVFKPMTEIVGAAPASGILPGTAVLQNALDLSDPGFLPYYPVAKDFNLLSVHDWRHSHFDTLNTELDVQLAETWVARFNYSLNHGYNAYKATGLTSVNIDVPSSYTSRFATYLDAAKAYAADIIVDPNIALLSPHAQLGRRQAFRETFGHNYALQAEVTGNMDLGSIKIRPLFGAYYDTGHAYDRRRQSGTNGTYTIYTAPSAANRAPLLAAWDFKNPSLLPINFDTDYDPMTFPLTTYTGTFFHTKAVYGLIDAKFFDERLIAIAGVRYNKSDIMVSNFLTTQALSDGPVANSSKTTPQVALGFKVEKDLMLYASYSQSYQPNGFLKKGDLPGVTAKPTTSEGFETGIKTSFMDGRVSSTICAYQIDQRDRVISLNVVQAGGAVGSFDSQGNTDRSKGVEAEITYSPLDNWQIYMSAALDDIHTVKVSPGLEVYLGTNPQSTARELVNLWTRYTFTADALKGLWVGGGFNHTSPKAGIVTNALVKLPASTLYNAALGYDWNAGTHPMSVRANWENISDAEYFPTVQDRGLPERVSFTLTARF
ncbi:MAG: fpvA 2 [Verrucomicrobia bacterium]|nr:fpvA 2 [Verrucomicrobiota bacterium]